MDRERERRADRAYGIGFGVFILIFGIVWCIMAASMGAGFMVIFGVGFVGLAAYRLVMTVRLTKEKTQQPEPWERPSEPENYTAQRRSAAGFCPYCGTRTEEGFEFCPKCGRRLTSN